MKRLIYILLLALVIGLPMQLAAQSKDAKKQIEAARIALITERLELTPEQAEKFWPVFREYDNKRRELRAELMESRRKLQGQEMASEEDNRKLMEKALEIKQRELDLEKSYTKKFDTVLSSKQILSLSQAERDFQQMLVKRIAEQRREQQLQQQKMQERQRQWQQQKNN